MQRLHIAQQVQKQQKEQYIDMQHQEAIIQCRLNYWNNNRTTHGVIDHKNCCLYYTGDTPIVK